MVVFCQDHHQATAPGTVVGSAVPSVFRSSVWNPVPSGTICDRNGFNTVGWPGVSVQNHHLDVYFPAFELFDFGRRTGNDRYERLGRLVFDAWSKGICTHPGEWEHRVPGEQGEHFYQTNYFQGVDGSHNWRGGHNPWNPSWIIAIVLEAAFRFKYEG